MLAKLLKRKSITEVRERKWLRILQRRFAILKESRYLGGWEPKFWRVMKRTKRRKLKKTPEIRKASKMTMMRKGRKTKKMKRTRKKRNSPKMSLNKNIACSWRTLVRSMWGEAWGKAINTEIFLMIWTWRASSAKMTKPMIRKARKTKRRKGSSVKTRN